MADSRLAQGTGVCSTRKAFENHMWDFTKYGYTLVSLILGHDLGIFETMRNATTPLTSVEIAENANLEERYVREWLGAVTAAQVITVEIKDGVCRYNLTKENYDTIVSSVTYGRGICACIGRLDVTKTHFKKGGPTGDQNAFDEAFWDFFGRFRDQDSKTTIPLQIFPKMETVETLSEKLRIGCSVLDIGCGNGKIITTFAKRYPNSVFTGFDVSEDVLNEAMATSGGIQNLKYKHGNSDDIYSDLWETFDVIFLFEVLHNLPDPLKMIENVQRLLKSAGHLILLETPRLSNHAENVGDLSIAMQLTISQFYCLPCSMSNKPNIGYGIGWGNEEMLKALSKYFSLVARFSLSNHEDLYCLSKLPT